MAKRVLNCESGPVTGQARSEATKLFILEEFTPLFHTAEYGSLPDAVRLRYNQLHALYFNEQVAFFEQEMLSPALRALARMALPPPLAKGVREFCEEEQRHTAMFRRLNQQAAPELYARSNYFFVGIGPVGRAAVREVCRQPRLFPVVLWLALMQEERSLFYSSVCLQHSALLDSRFVAAHRAHLADEVGHVAWDEELLEWLWPRTGRALRVLNARLLNWLVGEFFLLPKRSGLHVVQRLAREFPELESSALCRAMAGLSVNAAYLCHLYSRTITPRAFDRFDRHPEFALLSRTLPGYVPSPA
ncbi:MAG TPA: diiron oxygenase [Verrucomicrobiae bacterium]|nr:diiron oxygenase [Verrucomicrobiae bacterium]